MGGLVRPSTAAAVVHNRRISGQRRAADGHDEAMPTDQSTSTTNQVVLSGVFAGEAVLRTLPSGDELVSFRVTVARPPG
jgi:hypothetical protein